MKKITKKLAFLLVLSIFSNPMFSQVVTCNGILPFEEQNGLLTIEMESGILPSGSNWQTGSEADPNLSGSTINYIFWNGTQSFNALPGATITYNIKINNPGTYRFAWRGRIGTGSSGGEHNDAWLRIVADDFYANNQNSSTATPALEPRPNCNSNPNRDCPEGSSVNGYFKAFMNRHPTNLPINERWGFVTNTNDGSAFRFIWATFNAAGNYAILVDARSSFFFIDKMVLRRTDVSDTDAFKLENNQSSCFDASLALEKEDFKNITMFPNPTKGKIQINNVPIKTNLIISNIYGGVVREITTEHLNQTIDISDLNSGVYFITNRDKTLPFSKKIIKL